MLHNLANKLPFQNLWQQLLARVFRCHITKVLRSSIAIQSPKKAHRVSSGLLSFHNAAHVDTVVPDRLRDQTSEAVDCEEQGSVLTLQKGTDSYLL